MGTQVACLARAASQFALFRGWLGQVGDPCVDDFAPVELLLNAFFKCLFGAGHFKGRLKLAVWQLSETFPGSGDTGKAFHMVIPGCDISVAHWPVYAVPIPKVGSKIQVSKSVALPCPGQGAAAKMVTPQPIVVSAFRCGVGVFAVLDPEVFVRLLDSVSNAAVLNRIVSGNFILRDLIKVWPFPGLIHI